MAKDKKSFLIYQSWKQSYDLLTDTEKLQFVENLFNYNIGEAVILNTPMLKMLWSSIEYNLNANTKRYETYRINGSKGGAPKGNNNAKKQPNSTENNLNQPNTSQNNLNVNDNVNANVNANANVNVNDNVNENANAKSIDDLFGNWGMKDESIGEVDYL
jgi:hypothetical protein